MISVNLLPKNLRRVREPGYWKLLTVLLPLLAFGVIFAFQYTADQTVRNLEDEKQRLEDRLALLQPALREQRELQQRQAQLRELISVAQAVRENHIVWSSEISAMLENLPAQGNGDRPRIDFRSLNMQSVVPPRQDPDRYEGRTVVAEMSVSGNVINTEVLADFIAALEDSAQYGVIFQNASRQAERDIYTYNLTIGAYGGENASR